MLYINWIIYKHWLFSGQKAAHTYRFTRCTKCHNSFPTTNQSVLPTSISLYSVTRKCIKCTLGLKTFPILCDTAGSNLYNKQCCYNSQNMWCNQIFSRLFLWNNNNNNNTITTTYLPSMSSLSKQPSGTSYRHLMHSKSAVWNSISATGDFAWIMVISLNVIGFWVNP